MDYVIVRRNNRREKMDVRVKRGCEISSDHYLLAPTIKINKEKININFSRK